MNPDNRWIRLADNIPWNEFEKKYADLFPSDTGNVAKPLRMALGSLIIQKKFQFSDRELVEQITENPYLQYFIGLPGYQDEPPFDPSTLVLFRKRLDVDAIMDANAYMFDSGNDDSHTPPSGTSPEHLSSPSGKTVPGPTGNKMELYSQQQYMYDQKVHSVPERIVSIRQPWVRPIVRGKAKAPTEFGAKFDVSIDERGYARIEHISFGAYNESQYLQEVVQRYYERTGHYPERYLYLLQIFSGCREGFSAPL